jgi:NADPH:quinone reductase
VYGASSAVGSYVIQHACQSNIHPIIGVAGRAQEHVEKLIDRSKGDTIVDYRKGDDAVVQGIKDALRGAKLEYAYDAVSEKGSFVNLSKVLDPQNGHITLVLPPPGGWGGKFSEIPESVHQSTTNVGSVHGPLKDLGFVYSRYFTRGLEEGWFKAQPQEIVPGGLGGIQSALEKLKDGTASAVKYVFRIADTEGAGSGK